MGDKTTLADKLRTEYEEAKTKLEELRVQAALGKAELRDELQPHLDQAQIKLDHLQEQMAKLADSADDVWDSVREKCEAGLGEVKEAFRGLVDRFK